MLYDYNVMIYSMPTTYVKSRSLTLTEDTSTVVEGINDPIYECNRHAYL